MFAVIFKAKVGEQDDHYGEMVTLMRDLAFAHYHCQDFIAVTEGEQEIAISYWNSEEDIRNWHQDSQHRIAQQFGQERWYQSYTVEFVEVRRRYSFGEN